MSSYGPSLTQLPAELIAVVFSFLPADSLVALERASKSLHTAANEQILWRNHCLDEYQFWEHKHEILAKKGAPVQSTDWKALYRQRRTTDKEIGRKLDAAIAAQQGRMARIQAIAAEGYDAKDLLLRNFRVGEDVEDWLARRHWSTDALGCIHRRSAIEMWSALSAGGTFPMEQSLAGLDMFVVGAGEATADAVSAWLDALAEQVLTEDPGFHDQSTRQKALALVTFLRKHGFRGVDAESYSALRNNFIGRALQDPEHPSLPLVLVTIYCAIATRVGIDAHACGFPFHIYGIVNAPAGHTLNGRQQEPGEPPDLMYVDPFRTDEEVSINDLKRILRRVGGSLDTDPEFLRAASALEMVVRACRNVVRSVQEAPEYPLGDDSHQAAFYGALWALLLLQQGRDGTAALRAAAPRLQTLIHHVLEQLQSHYMMDTDLFERYALPVFDDAVDRQALRDIMESLRQADLAPRAVVRRAVGDEPDDGVRYRVGQVFRHRRYSYVAVVTGWDPVCHAGEEWIRQMGVDRLPSGRHQSFYHILAEDRSTRYVAEENIEILQPEEPPERLLSMGGRYFKRWDHARKKFVSNVRDVYPDD